MPPTPRPKPPALALSIAGESDTDTVSMVTALSRASSPADTVFTAPLWSGTPTPATPKYPGAWDERYATPPLVPATAPTVSASTIGLGRPPRRRRSGAPSDRSHAGSERTLKTVEYPDGQYNARGQHYAANGPRHVSGPPAGWVSTLPPSPPPARRAVSQTMRYAYAEDDEEEEADERDPAVRRTPRRERENGRPRAPLPPVEDFAADDAWAAFVRAQLQRMLIDSVAASQHAPPAAPSLAEHVAALRGEIDELRRSVAAVAANQRPAGLVAAVEDVAAAVESVAAAESVAGVGGDEGAGGEAAEEDRAAEQFAVREDEIKHVEEGHDGGLLHRAENHHGHDQLHGEQEQWSHGHEQLHHAEMLHHEQEQWHHEQQQQHHEHTHQHHEQDQHRHNIGSHDAHTSAQPPSEPPSEPPSDRGPTPTAAAITVPGRAGPLHLTPTTVSLVLEVVRAIDRARHVDRRPDVAIFDDDNLAAIIDDARQVLDDEGVSVWSVHSPSHSVPSDAASDASAHPRRLVVSEASDPGSGGRSAPLSPRLEAELLRAVTTTSPEPLDAARLTSVIGTPAPSPAAQ